VFCPGIQVIARNTWKVDRMLTEHQPESLVVEWSPNGDYLVSSHRDNSIIIWDTKTWESVGHHTFSALVTGLAWSPKGNTLVVATVDGKIAVIDNIIQRRKDKDSAKKTNVKDEIFQQQESVAKMFDDDEINDKDLKVPENNQTDQNLQSQKRDLDVIADLKAKLEAQVEEKRSKSSRLKKSNIDVEAVEDNIDEDEDEMRDFIVDSDSLHSGGLRHKKRDSFHQQLKSAKLSTRVGVAAADSGPKFVEETTAPITNRQTSFQPSSSAAEEDKRRILVWNMIGAVVARYDNNMTAIEVDFNDQSKHKNMSLSRNLKISYGALSEKALVLASEPTENVGSTVMYIQFETWAPNTDWAFHLPPGETTNGLALGEKFVALATSKRYLRLFSYSGIQRHILCLNGDVCTMIAKGHILVIVYFVDGSKHLEFVLFNVPKKETLCEGVLPLGRDTRLEWIGFTEEDSILCTMDSAGVLRALISPMKEGEWGGRWVPILESSSCMPPGRKAWPIGVALGKLVYIPLSEDKNSPPPFPRPLPSSVELEIPLLDSANSQLEEEYILSSLSYNYTKAHLAAEGTIELNQQLLLNKQIELDAILIKLIHQNCNNNKSEKALDLSTTLLLKKSFELAIKIATKANLAPLAQRIAQVAEKHLQSPSHQNFRSEISDVLQPPLKKQRTSQEITTDTKFDELPSNNSFSIDADETIATEDEMQDFIETTTQTTIINNNKRNNQNQSQNQHHNNNLSAKLSSPLVPKQSSPNSKKVQSKKKTDAICENTGTMLSSPQKSSAVGSSIFDALKRLTPALDTSPKQANETPNNSKKRKNFFTTTKD